METAEAESGNEMLLLSCGSDTPFTLPVLLPDTGVLSFGEGMQGECRDVGAVRCEARLAEAWAVSG